MVSKKLIVSLITDDLINQKLTNGLREMGIDAENYQLNIGSMVFELMKIKRDVNDSFFEQYMNLAEASKGFSFEDERKPFERLALEIYGYLRTLKKATN